MSWLRKPKVDWRNIDSIVDFSKDRVLTEAEHLKLKGTLEKLERHLTPEPKASEKQSDLVEGASETGDKKKSKAKGHGRNGAKQLDGVATRIPVPHPTLEHAQVCPSCHSGKLYSTKMPAVTWKFIGQPMLEIIKYDRAQLKCNTCDALFTAPNPEGVSDQKYDDSVPAVLALSRYGSGLPGHRIERLLQNFGVPFPASTQWELVSEAADQLKPLFDEFLRQAANSPLVHLDDTGMKIIKCKRDIPGRTGIHTTAMVAQNLQGPIALFLSGEKHAGENLEALLSKRLRDLPENLILMSDALSMNTSKLKGLDISVLLANCMAHARRNFVNVCSNFPGPCQHVLAQLGKVYRIDSIASKLKLGPNGRTIYHRIHSKPILENLKRWLQKAEEDKIYEPASGLGLAVNYLNKHWTKLTEFLRTPGIPLDNNICERAIKKMVLYRKNSLFYRNNNGAEVGDLFMTLIHTCELNQVNAYDYLVALISNSGAVAKDPKSWLPWNFAQQGQLERV